MIRFVAPCLAILLGAGACTDKQPTDAASGANARGSAPTMRTTFTGYPRRIARQVTEAEADAIEARVSMPDGGQPLAAYARYYTYVTLGGHELIEAYFVAGFGGPPGRYLNKEGPLVDDGGCSIITLYYDPQSGHIAGLSCNGRA